MNGRDLWFGTSGPRSAEIAICGETWGSEEEAQKFPFVGESGKELNRMLAEAGIARGACFATNIISAQPEGNKAWKFFHPRAEAPSQAAFGGLHPTEFAMDEILRCYGQLAEVKPRVILAVGNYALWALAQEAIISYRGSDDGKPCGRLVPSGILRFRGSQLRGAFGAADGVPVLPIIHPAAILREWKHRHVTVHDLKVRIPQALSGDWDQHFEINPRPRFAEVMDHLSDLHADTLIARESGSLSRAAIDLETRRGLVTCLSIAPAANAAITIPLMDKRGGEFCSYWRPREEAEIITALRAVCTGGAFGAIGQNFLYDQTYFMDAWGFCPPLAFDTMLAHHLLFPGTPKDLGYLSSLYCNNHRYWKEDNREWDMKASPDDHYRYNAEDAIRTFEIAGVLERLITATGMTALWQEELEKQRMAFEMMQRGIRVDRAERDRMLPEMITAAEERQGQLWRLIPQRWVDPTARTPWFNSNKQLKVVFRDILQVPLKNHRKTGMETLNAEALEEMRESHPHLRGLLDLLDELRTIGVITSNVLRAPLDPDGRMRCTFNTAGTKTFRWSSSKNPLGRGLNLQNIPNPERK